jgi:hypothetical protein
MNPPQKSSLNENKWKVLELEDEVEKDLSRTVNAVDLPRKVSPDKTYPGLILDGASGVGKTQQAFTMLRNGERLVYQLLARPADREQPIYTAMRRFGNILGSPSGLGSTSVRLDLVELAVNEVMEEAKEIEKKTTQQLPTHSSLRLFRHLRRKPCNKTVHWSAHGLPHQLHSPIPRRQVVASEAI